MYLLIRSIQILPYNSFTFSTHSLVSPDMTFGTLHTLLSSLTDPPLRRVPNINFTCIYTLFFLFFFCALSFLLYIQGMLLIPYSPIPLFNIGYYESIVDSMYLVFTLCLPNGVGMHMITELLPFNIAYICCWH